MNNQPPKSIFKEPKIDGKVGVGFSVTASTIATLDRWVIDLKAQQPAGSINRGHVLALIVSSLDAIGWKPGMKVMITVKPLHAGAEVTTPLPRANQLAKSKRSSAKS